MLETLERELAARSHGLTRESMRIRGVWRVDHVCKPIPEERLLRFGFVMLQTEHPGCCYTEFDGTAVADWERYIGADIRDIDHANVPLRIAGADAWAALAGRGPDRELLLDGAPASKAQARAHHVVDLVESVAGGGRRLNVALIGVIGAFAAELRRRGHRVLATDYDAHLLREGIDGIPVLDGDLSPDTAAGSDVALVCGETLINDTLQPILERAAASATPVVVYAVTGANLASLYVDHFGVAAVLSEPQPQYLFHGRTRLGVHSGAQR